MRNLLLYVVTVLVALCMSICLCLSVLLFQAGDPVGGIGFAILTVFFGSGIWMLLTGTGDL